MIDRLKLQFATGRSPHLRILSNSSWNLLQQIVTLASSSIVGILLVRALPVEEYGVYSYAIALCSIGIAVMSAGLSGLAVKALVEQPENNGATMAALLAVRETFALIGFLLIAMISYASTNNLFFIATLLASLALFGRAMDVPEFWYLSRLRSRKTVTIRVAIVGLLLAARIAGMIYFPNVWLFLGLYSMEAFVSGLMIIRRYLRESDSSGFAPPQFKQIRSLLNQSLPLLLSSVASQVNLKGDIVIIQLLLGATSVGVYSAAARISELAYFLPVVVMNSVFPSLLSVRRDYGEHHATYRDLLQRSYDVAFWSGMVVAVGAFGAGSLLISEVFGADYEQSKSVLAIHVMACPFVFMAAVYSKWIIAEGILWTSMLRHGLGAVANVILCIYLIPMFDVQGAALASLLSYTVASYLSCFVGGQKNRQAGIAMTRAFIAPFRYASRLGKV